MVISLFIDSIKTAIVVMLAAVWPCTMKNAVAIVLAHSMMNTIIALSVVLMLLFVCYHGQTRTDCMPTCMVLYGEAVPIGLICVPLDGTIYVDVRPTEVGCLP